MKQYSFLTEAEELTFGNFPITTDIVDKALGNIKGWKCSSGGDSGEPYCSYTKTKGHNRAEIAIRINGDTLNVKFYLYRTPDDNQYLHGDEKEVKHYVDPIERNLKIPDGGTWKDLDFSWIHKGIRKFDKDLDNVKEEDLEKNSDEKFKNGDRVKIASNIRCMQAGKEAIITGCRKNQYGYDEYCCKIDDPTYENQHHHNGEKWWFTDHYLTKIGD